MNLHTLYIILEYFIFLPLDIFLILFVFPKIIINTYKEFKKAFFPVHQSKKDGQGPHQKINIRQDYNSQHFNGYRIMK